MMNLVQLAYAANPADDEERRISLEELLQADPAAHARLMAELLKFRTEAIGPIIDKHTYSIIRKNTGEVYMYAAQLDRSSGELRVMHYHIDNGHRISTVVNPQPHNPGHITALHKEFQDLRPQDAVNIPLDMTTLNDHEIKAKEYLVTKRDDILKAGIAKAKPEELARLVDTSTTFNGLKGVDAGFVGNIKTKIQDEMDAIGNRIRKGAENSKTIASMIGDIENLQRVSKSVFSGAEAIAFDASSSSQLQEAQKALVTKQDEERRAAIKRSEKPKPSTPPQVPLPDQELLSPRGAPSTRELGKKSTKELLMKERPRTELGGVQKPVPGKVEKGSDFRTDGKIRHKVTGKKQEAEESR